MEQDKSLRLHIQKLLDWQDAHTTFEAAVKGVKPELRGVLPDGLPYSLWQVLEHLRLCQWDILDFCINPDYKEPNFEELWPKNAEPPNAEAWDQSIVAYRKDRESLIKLAADTKIDLFAKIPHGSGQTYLRELLLVADHNAYHIADLVAIRRVLGNWG